LHRRQPPEGFEPFEEQGPFLAHIGPVYVRREDGSPVRPARRGAPQQPPRDDPGRLLSTFADFALGRAIEADAGDGKDRATVSLTVDFLKPAEAGD
jgi:acyl-coenzyme A thioesterase PaaI-like protein